MAKAIKTNRSVIAQKSPWIYPWVFDVYRKIREPFQWFFMRLFSVIIHPQKNSEVFNFAVCKL
jgi:hypothetical protein